MTPTSVRRGLWLSLLALTALWLLAEPDWAKVPGYFAFRTLYMQYSGVLAIGVMSLTMMLAARPRIVERAFGGLDKMYRLHKWLGIAALVTSVVHWWLGQGTKWMVGWGWLERPQRGPRPPQAAVEGFDLEATLRGLRGVAESVGEWAFYLAAILMVLALIKRFPYRWFAKTHQFIAVGYLVLVFHTVVLFKFSYWAQPLGLLMALLLTGGTVSAVLVLTRQVGARRKVAATVERSEVFPAIATLSTELTLAAGWPGHAAGQFAFVTVDRAEGAHPYTMASAWDPATRRIRFVTKALGDHTRQLPQLLQPGTAVTVEGPYGCFDFEDGHTHQVWIGAGIGITPFIARLEQLARAPKPVQVDLIHPTAVEEPAALERLRAAARAAGVRLHVLVDARDGRLDAQRLQTLVPHWAQASVWFCGPAGFGQALWEGLSRAGLARRAFHQELFEMR
jgi:predicted ferric reductase